MKINHTIDSIDKSTGGPARSVTHLISKILEISNDLSIELTTLRSKNPVIKSFNKNNNICFFKKKIKFNKLYDLYHAQGIWKLPMHSMVQEAKKNKKPYIITIRGMLEYWSLKQGSVKKKIALMLYQHNDLKNAACLHATSEMEVDSIRNLGLRNPIAMIPNGININKYPKEPSINNEKTRKILFLSRIHPKKGIENLLEAWLKIESRKKKNWVLEIVGNGDSKYIEKLSKLIITYQLERQVFILPPVFGIEKINLYREASLFVLPTFSENFGIVIAEALASYTPVITTKGAPWSDLKKYNCGWWIDIGVEPLIKSLEEALTCKKEALIIKGQNGRILIEDKYSIDSVALKMIELYNWILKKSEKPNFVYLK